MKYMAEHGNVINDVVLISLAISSTGKSEDLILCFLQVVLIFNLSAMKTRLFVGLSLLSPRRFTVFSVEWRKN